MKPLDWLLDLLYPPKCPFCGRVGDRRGVCPRCRETLPWTAGAETVQERRGLRCASPLFYEDAVRASLLRLKFSGAAGLAEGLGDVLAACAAEQFSGGFDTVTWVPVSRKRLRRRGYDQARLLAEAAGRRWGVKPEPLLEKTADNPAQSTLAGASARRANVLGLYRASERAAGRRILLVDDIVTTGSTLDECARTLREAGAAEVLAVTVARTRPKKEESSGANGFSDAMPT